MLNPIESPILKDDGFDRSKTNQIFGIFPNKSESELLEVILSNKECSVDELIDVILSSDVEDIPTDILNLLEMVPDESLDRITRVYNNNNHNFDQTLACLTEVIDDYGPSQMSKKLSQVSKQLSQVSGYPETLTIKYLNENSGDYIKALIGIVNNEIKVDDIPKESRVQRRRKRQYHYDKNKTEAKQLEEMYEEDAQMRQFNKQFLQKLLVFVKGNLTDLLEIISIILEVGYEDLTRDEVLNLSGLETDLPRLTQIDSKSGSNSGTRSIFNRTKPLRFPAAGEKLKQSRTTIAVNEWKTNNVHTYRIQGTSKQNNEPPIHDNRVDLHRYQVHNALAVVDKILNDWWEMEIDERTNFGKNIHGSKAQHVKPLEIVTGRGIHSKDGVPRIRIHVGKYLKRENYIYDEESWGYIVTGRRT